MEFVIEYQRTGSGELSQKYIVKLTGMGLELLSRCIKSLLEKRELTHTYNRAIYIPFKGTYS